MSNERLPDGPDRDQLIALLRETYPHAVVATIEGAAFFSLDESNWPNFATVVWADDFDMGEPSRLTRPGTYRVNIGLSREAYRRLVGSVTDPDHSAFDRVVPHPVYARQRWVSVLNPSHQTVRDLVMPLIAEAHDRLMAARERRSGAPAAG